MYEPPDDPQGRLARFQIDESPARLYDAVKLSKALDQYVAVDIDIPGSKGDGHQIEGVIGKRQLDRFRQNEGDIVSFWFFFEIAQHRQGEIRRNHGHFASTGTPEIEGHLACAAAHVQPLRPTSGCRDLCSFPAPQDIESKGQDMIDQLVGVRHL